MRKALFVIVIVFLSFISISTARAGDRIGEFCWQLSFPYDDIFCVDVEMTSRYTFALSGEFSSATDGYKYPIAGNVIYDPKSNIYKVQFQSAAIYDGDFIDFALAANLSARTYIGIWMVTGNTGTLVYWGSKSSVPEADPSEGRMGLFGD